MKFIEDIGDWWDKFESEKPRTANLIKIVSICAFAMLGTAAHSYAAEKGKQYAGESNA